MRRIVTILFVIIALSYRIFAQNNLVPNPGFENFYPNDTFCNAGPVIATPPWIDPTGGSPDCFKTCCIHQPNYLIPQNIFGYQYPNSGIGYAGLCHNEAKLLPNFREYIQVKLSESLKANKKYLVEFFVNLSDSSCYASDDMGMYLSDTAVYHSGAMDYSPLNYEPQIKNKQGNIITDKENWTLISGIYTAHGGEQYITIGNFYDDANTDTLFVGGAVAQGKYSYYYIDDVSVVLCEDTKMCDTTGINENSEKKTEIRIYPNPANNQLTIEFPSYSANNKTTIELFDINGKLLNNLSIQGNKTQINLNEFPAGIYVVKVIENTSVAVRKIVVRK